MRLHAAARAPEHYIVPDGKIVDGVEEMRKAVREEIKHGSDWIKLLVTGAFMSAGDRPEDVHYSEDEMRTAVEEAGGMTGIPSCGWEWSVGALENVAFGGASSRPRN